MNTELLEPSRCSPFWYGVGLFFVTPVAAILCFIAGLFMLLAWPLIPYAGYRQMKAEILKARAVEQKP